jgi:Putative restriction endonuclease
MSVTAPAQPVTPPTAEPLPPAVPPLRPMRRFTVDEYHRLIEAGFFAHDERYELLDGWIIHKMSRNPPHELVIMLLEDALPAILPADWIRRTQSAVTLSRSEPEPDISIVRGPKRRYSDHHPGPSEIGLVVEVADTSVAEDRTVQGSIYARDSLPVYWIVNIPDRCIEVYTDPTGPGEQPTYRNVQSYRPPQEIPLWLEGREVARIPVRDLLP